MADNPGKGEPEEECGHDNALLHEIHSLIVRKNKMRLAGEHHASILVAGKSEAVPEILYKRDL
ncbi:hypothetical protein M5G07_00025 [Serratia symbiotica]|nr:hypothetical protein [Serratia symbiotica]